MGDLPPLPSPVPPDDLAEASLACVEVLGRLPRDRHEAAVALEAYRGVPAATALRFGGDVLRSADRHRDLAPLSLLAAPRSEAGESDLTSPTSPAGADPAAEALSSSTPGVSMLGEFAFVATVVLVGFWMSSLGQRFGTHEVERAWRVALPLTLGVQWFLRRRFLAGDQELGRIPNDKRTAFGAIGIAVGVALLFGGWLGAALAAIWTAGFVVARRGWWAAQFVLLAGAWVLQRFWDHEAFLVGFAAFLVVTVMVHAVLTSPASSRKVGPWGSAILAGLLGAGLGALLVVEPEFAWEAGVPLPILTVVPSLLGSLWGAAHMTKLWEVMPSALSERRVSLRSRTAGSVAVTKLFFAAIGRVIGCCGMLSLAVYTWARVTGRPETITARLLAAHALLAIAGLCVSLLEAFGRAGRALTIVLGAIAFATVLPKVHAVPDSPAMRILSAAFLCAAVSLVALVRLLRTPAHTVALGI